LPDRRPAGPGTSESPHDAAALPADRDRTAPAGGPRGGGPRVLIVHEWLVAWAGSERVVEQLLAVFPDADLVTGIVAPAMRDLNAVTRRARESWLGSLPGARSHHRWFLPLHPAAFASLDTRGYDLVISSSHAFAKSVRVAPPAVHVCMCYSPPRYLWGMQAQYRQGGAAQSLGLTLMGPLLRAVDRRAARGVDHFVAISDFVKARIARAYGREAEVIHPPVQARAVAPRRGAARGDFLLTLGRLVPYKRVDLAIGAARRAGIRLVVAGDGPERRRLEALAAGDPNVEFRGEVSEQEAGELLEGCRAFLFCAEEDYGIAPIEANAHGAPVVGFGRGGLLETMVPGRTAELFDAQSVEAVAAALSRALRREWDDAVLRANAARFGPEAWRARVAASCQAALRRGTARRAGRAGRPGRG
jgi:glycosyltransferase involved in cell wall biosynthesis